MYSFKIRQEGLVIQILSVIMSKNKMVTGGAGHIGSHTCVELLDSMGILETGAFTNAIKRRLLLQPPLISA